MHNIFLVDDHPLVLEGLERFVNGESDLRVCGAASTARDATTRIPCLDVQLVVTDLSLGKESGYEFIAALSSKFPALPVLVLSMHEEPSFAERALAAGARGYVTKSSSTEEILGAMRQILRGGTYIPQNILRHVLLKERTPQHSPNELLSAREREVFQLLGRGYKTKRIAHELKVSSKTIDSHCANIKSKLKLSDAHELVQQATIWAHTK
jgi:DNA-binding NarL/FixJ family response regulator